MKKLGFSFYFSTGYLKEVHRGLTSVTLNTDFFFFPWDAEFSNVYILADAVAF